jgi:alpha-glucosidase (family GH31 glycosyl hydrolase)
MRICQFNTNTIGDEAGRCMRVAMNLRYALIPTIYTYAHEQYTTGRPIYRPLMMEYPSDATVAHMTTQWLLGDGIMVAPVLTQDNNVQVYLPQSLWFQFNTSRVYSGPATLSLTNVPYDVLPIYVRAGTIVALQANTIQYTDQLGGTLSLHVYAGVNGTFTLVEDDGETKSYESGVTTTTKYLWDDNNRRLGWQVTRQLYSGPRLFTNVVINVFFTNGYQMTASRIIGQSGSVQF